MFATRFKPADAVICAILISVSLALMLIPAAIYYILFCYVPMFGASMAFKKFNPMVGIWASPWVGMKWFDQLFKLKKFYQVFINTISISCIRLLFGFPFPIIIALLLGLSLQKDRRMNSLAKRAMFFPHIVSGVSISMIFAWLLNAQGGLFNQILQMFGAPGLKWLDSSQTALPSVIGINVWKAVGYYTLIILAALGSIPAEINEAAELDNTPAWRKFLRITFPMLSPQLFFMLVNITIGSFKVFDLVRLLTNGGPGTATYVLVLYIYRYAFEWSLQIGYASAAGVVLMAILLVMTVLYFKLLEKRVHYQ